jgi:hypothetical protein
VRAFPSRVLPMVLGCVLFAGMVPAASAGGAWTVVLFDEIYRPAGTQPAAGHLII